MISQTEKQQIADYVLDPDNQRRLDLAIGIVESYEEIKRRIIFEFAERLEIRLREQFPTFMVEVRLRKYYPERFIDATVTKSSWNGIRIGFEAQAGGARNFIIGIHKPQSRNNWPHLFAALNNGYMAGRNNEWWDYYRWFDGFTNWDHETLIKLRNPKSLDDVVEQFDRICAIAEPIIDNEMMTSRTTLQGDGTA